MSKYSLTLPVRGRGVPTAKEEAAHRAAVELFCEELISLRDELDFTPGVRGWCYILEEYGLAKGDFDKAEKTITALRKSGDLPLDITTEEESHAFDGVEKVDDSPEDEAMSWVSSIQDAHDNYNPISFWDDKDVYLQLVVEKVDLKSLFGNVCRRYRIPFANARGSSSLHLRAAMMKRFARHERAGRRPVLLYCGDLDPSGVLISDSLMQHCRDMEIATGWDPSGLTVDRFGLNADFIEEHKLSWVEGLETGSKKKLDLGNPTHPHHNQAYVQDYIAKYGKRKVEANALVTRPEAGRQLLLDTIHKYLSPDSPEDHEERMEPFREQMQEAVLAAVQKWVEHLSPESCPGRRLDTCVILVVLETTKEVDMPKTKKLDVNKIETIEQAAEFEAKMNPGPNYLETLGPAPKTVLYLNSSLTASLMGMTWLGFRKWQIRHGVRFDAVVASGERKVGVWTPVGVLRLRAKRSVELAERGQTLLPLSTLLPDNYADARVAKAFEAYEDA